MTNTGYVYKASAGESFDTLALAIFGDEKYASELLSANPSLCDKMIFDGTEEIEIPVVDTEDAAGEVYMPADAPWKE